ncbi:hypothetical protein ACLB1N_00480 [Escherichia coli]
MFAHTSKHLLHRQCLRITASSPDGLSDDVGRGDVFNPQRRINGFMFFSLSVLNLEDHRPGLPPQSPLSAGYITLRACRRSLPLRFSTVTPVALVSHRELPVQIVQILAVHLSIHARPDGHTGKISHPQLVMPLTN